MNIVCRVIYVLVWAAASNLLGADRPNIVWVLVEDMSANFGCYGETTIQTPHVDRLASHGLRFTNAIVTAPVCSTCRSALITGMYQTSIGAHHHRSGRGKMKIKLPSGVRPIPKLFKEAGYHVSNLSTAQFIRSDVSINKNPNVKPAKTDYNFEWDRLMYDLTHWASRRNGQPFFCQIQPRGGKLRGNGTGSKWPERVQKVLGSCTELSAVKLPLYLPSDPVIVEDWAQYLDTVRYTDWELGQIVDRLEANGDLHNTYIFFLTDHGISHVRNKQFCYEGGAHIPLIVYGPTLKPDVRTDVVQHIDIGATSLALAGIGIPEGMQSRDILDQDYQPREFGYCARDRCDETVDRIRSVRSKRYKYIRNQLPQRPYLQPNRYKDGKPIVQAMRRLHAEGKLNAAQAKIMAESRPSEELYDLLEDPNELENLAGNPDYVEIQTKMRTALDRWIGETGDRGQQVEGPMYDSDMLEYGLGLTDTERGEILARNVALMKKWESEGR